MHRVKEDTVWVLIFTFGQVTVKGIMLFFCKLDAHRCCAWADTCCNSFRVQSSNGIQGIVAVWNGVCVAIDWRMRRRCRYVAPDRSEQFWERNGKCRRQSKATCSGVAQVPFMQTMSHSLFGLSSWGQMQFAPPQQLPDKFETLTNHVVDRLSLAEATVGWTAIYCAGVSGSC